MGELNEDHRRNVGGPDLGGSRFGVRGSGSWKWSKKGYHFLGTKKTTFFQVGPLFLA